MPDAHLVGLGHERRADDRVHQVGAHLGFHAGWPGGESAGGREGLVSGHGGLQRERVLAKVPNTNVTMRETVAVKLCTGISWPARHL